MKLNEYLQQGDWKIVFNDPERQKEIGSKIDYCSADVVNGKIIIHSPILNKPINVAFDNPEEVGKNRFIDPFENNLIEYDVPVTDKQKGVILYSKGREIFRLIPLN